MSPLKKRSLLRPKPKGEGSALTAKTILDHISDLRRVLVFCLGLVGALFLVIFSLYSKTLVDWISLPIQELNITIIYTNVSEAFTAQIKLSFIAAVVAASPLLFLSMWLYVRPALYPKERWMFGGVAAAAFVLFAGGVVFAYLMVFRLAVNFFVIAGQGVATPMLSLERYVDFLFAFLLPFGVLFQVPIAILILTRLGLVTPRILGKYRKYIILAVFVLAAVITPPDVVSQVLLGGPILVLFEVGVLLSHLVRPRDVEREPA